MRSDNYLTPDGFPELVIIATETPGALGDAKEHLLVISLVELLPHAVLQAHVGGHGRVIPSAVAEHGVNWTSGNESRDFLIVTTILAESSTQGPVVKFAM